MSLTTRLNVDVLLHLLKFMNPTDQFNLVLSGVLKGFKNVNQFTDLTQRSEGILIKLAPSNNSQMIEIGSLKCDKYDTTNRKILENMAKAGYFTHVWTLRMYFGGTSIENAFTLEDLAHVFHFYPKLTRLCLEMNGSWESGGNSQIHADLANQLRQGFGRLERLKLTSCLRYLFLNSWSIYQEILTWCGECNELSVHEDDVLDSILALFKRFLDPAVLNLSLVPTNLHFGQKLQKLDFQIYNCDDLLKWLLPFYQNIQTLINNPSRIHSAVGVDEFLQLRNLRNLSINISTASELEWILRNCLHLESLNVAFLTSVDEDDLAGVLIQPADNIVDLELSWLFSPSIGEILPFFKRWQHLRRLSLLLDRWIAEMEFMPEVETERPVLTFISDLIPHMKCLNYLYIDDDGFDDEELVIFKMEVDEWVKLHRPGFVLEMRNSDACRSLSWKSKEMFF